MIQRRTLLVLGVMAILAIITYFIGNKENYQQMKYCAQKYYGELGRDVLYMDCKLYGYVKPVTENERIKLYKCKIGLPSNTIKYKIIVDGIERYTELMEAHDFGPTVGTYLMFDNNKMYQVLSNSI